MRLALQILRASSFGMRLAGSPTDSDIGQFGFLERCHSVLAAMWIMDKCELSDAIHPYQWDIDIFHKDGKRSMGAYDPGDSD